MTKLSAPNWQKLSEQTGYRVLTFPTGETITADLIGSVRMATENGPRRVLIDVMRGDVMRGNELDVDDVFAMATAAHRSAAMRSAALGDRR